MKNWLYRLFVSDINDHCYRNCLDYFPDASVILDVGIGNGMMMKNYHDVIKSKRLRITGVDIDQTYLRNCRGLIQDYQLGDYIEIHQNFIEYFKPAERIYFDFILFSMSFMLLNDQRLVLERIKDWLKPDGEIIFFQTIYKEKFPVMEIIKPRLKYVTTIDFGTVTYEKEFYALLHKHALSILEDRLVKKAWFKGEYRMIATSLNRK
ncbi:MAG: class I SAM-dependent methyltransferase [Deltaproteobacteria bacterium]|nr:class I SAM-dependent methyltransferase [Deltaproteobacteria bacterium]